MFENGIYQQYMQVIKVEDIFGMRFCLSTLPSNPTSQLDVLWHNGHSLGVNGAQVCVFEQSNQVSLTGFLKKV